jgi:hypothetical protein
VVELNAVKEDLRKLVETFRGEFHALVAKIEDQISQDAAPAPADVSATDTAPADPADNGPKSTKVS